MDNPNIQQIPLHQLELSNHNARRTPPGGTADLELNISRRTASSKTWLYSPHPTATSIR